MSIATESIDLTHDGAERRRGLRIRQNRPVKVFDPASARYVGGQTQDVSASGLRLKLPMSSPILPGRLVHVHVGISDGPEGLAQRRGMIPARVVWIDRSEGASMTAGVELVTRAAAADAA
ncbi:MAG: PilZ domain-containing protein [Phycisphaerae bacterium]|nr:PilZ domain-containing protein [Phycisphaerae bacterium]MDW8262616.1 PilZ domain-containing protein [Phycisphaerales bacterium]